MKNVDIALSVIHVTEYNKQKPSKQFNPWAKAGTPYTRIIHLYDTGKQYGEKKRGKTRGLQVSGKTLPSS